MVKSWRTTTTAVVALAGILLVSTSGSSVPDQETLLLVGGQRGGPLHFKVEGRSVRGLYPGSTRQMRITVRNPLGFRLSLRQLTAKVSSSSRRGCLPIAKNLQVRRYSGPLPVTVAASGRTPLAGSIPVVMPMGASQKCAGATFVITLSAVGVRMNR